MPIVSDRSPFKAQTITLSGYPYPINTTWGRERHQVGYRSGSKYEPVIPTTTDRGSAKALREYLPEMEDYFLGATSDGWSEHDRTFTALERSKGMVLQSSRTRKGTTSTQHREFFLDCWSPIFKLALPSSSSIKKEAESLIRGIVPERPYVDLTRTLFELKDAPQLFKLANYKPSSVQDLGGAYLNQVFGVQPTVGDMQKIAEVVLKVLPALQDEQASQEEVLYRSFTKRLDYAAVTTNGRTTSSGGPVYIPGRNGQIARLYNFWGGGDSALFYGTSSVESIDLRVYGRYRRIVVDSKSNHKGLRKKLESLLGSGLSASVIYDLTPYTWLLNWAWDFGSILRYQQALVGADIVAVGQGYTVIRKLDVGVTTTVGDNPHGSLYETSGSPGALVMRRESSTRTSGASPYSLTTGSWRDLTSSQWAILGALGLSRLPGVPKTR